MRLGRVGAEPRVLLEPRSRLGAELGLTGGVVEVHSRSLFVAVVGGPAKHWAIASHAAAPAPVTLQRGVVDMRVVG